MKSVIVGLLFLCFTVNTVYCQSAAKPMVSVVIKRSFDNKLILLPQNSSELKNTVFVLQMSNTEKADSEIYRLEDCAINVTKNSVEVFSRKTNKFVVIRLSDVAKTAVDKFKTVFEGIGLAKVITSDEGYAALTKLSVGGEPFGPIAGCGCKPNGTPPPAGGCTAGGAGASSCSVKQKLMGVGGDCSTACSAGNYACCNAQ